MNVPSDAIRAALAAHQRLASLPTRKHQRMTGRAADHEFGNRAKTRGPGIVLPGSRPRAYEAKPATAGQRANKWGFAPGELLRVTAGRHEGKVGAFVGIGNAKSVILKPHGAERFMVTAAWCERVQE